jgi:hypothetical protein
MAGRPSLASLSAILATSVAAAAEPSAESAADSKPSEADRVLELDFGDDDPSPPRAPDAGVLELDFGDESPLPASGPTAADLLDTLFDGTLTNEVAVDLGFETDWEQILRSTHRLDLSLAHELGAGFSVRVSGRMTWWIRASRDGDTRYQFGPELRDTWLRWVFPDVLDVVVGTQFFSWGTADVLTTHDVLNPVDLRESLSAGLETPKIPVFGVTLTHSSGPEFGLVLAWLPFFEPNRQYVFGDDFSLLGPDPAASPLMPPPAALAAIEQIDDSLVDELQPALLSAKPEHHHLDNSTLGARVTNTVLGVDIGVSWVWGWDRLPVLEVDPRLPALAGLLDGEPDPQMLADGLELLEALRSGDVAFSDLYRGHYERSHVVGLDLATTVWDLTLKAEAAWTSARVVYDASFTGHTSSAVRVMAGVDYAFETTLLIGLEASWERLLDIASDLDLFIDARDQVQLALVASLRLLPNDALQMRGAVLYGVALEDFVIVPEIAWKVTDGVLLSAGARLLEGPGLSRGGFFDDNDEAYLQSRVDF